MSRIHDMGGRLGDGPVHPEPEDVAVFAEPWHARVLALTLAAGALGKWNLDQSRHQRECLSPKDYMRFSYYEKWLSGLANILVFTGVVSCKELRQRRSLTPASALAARRLQPEQVRKLLASGASTLRDSTKPPQFPVGAGVVVSQPAENSLIPGGHSRLPAYVRGAKGNILRYHGAHILPDSHAHGFGEAPEALYSVAFRHGSLWAGCKHPDDEVVIDIWQSYLALSEP